MSLPLVSIIIPTYNRAHLISETLDSILVQTYTNWECIVVDDGSIDDTSLIVNNYCTKDQRFIYHKRPSNKKKGANACRNYGFELSKGEFINWFDDDDIMTIHFIDLKIKHILLSNADFLFSKSNDFDLKDNEKPMFNVDNNLHQINAVNFVTQKIVWCTLDFFSKRDFLENVRFNEILKSGQEYNFFCKYLQQNLVGLFLNNVLAKRRVHNNSIQQKQSKSACDYALNKYLVYFITFFEIESKATNTELNYLLSMAMSRAYDLSVLKKNVPHKANLLYAVFKHKRILKFMSFCISLVCSYISGKGYVLLNYSKKNN